MATPVLGEGPPIEALTLRLAACPSDFLALPRPSGTAGAPGVVVAAVVSDLLVDLGGPALDADSARWFDVAPDDPQARNRAAAVLVCCWLLGDPAFRSAGASGGAFELLTRQVAELAAVVAAPSLVADPDRREELARLCLSVLRLHPAGETDAQAEDRLATLDSIGRARVVAQTRAAEQRAAEVRAAMQRTAAAEAAARATRE